MLYRYSDPAMDADAFYHDQTAASEIWEQEHYKGKCPFCGEEMFEGSADIRDRAVESPEFGWVHEICLDIHEDEEEADEMYELHSIQQSLEDRLSEIA